MNSELAQAIIASAGRLGVDPVDIATAMSYETGGKMSPSMWGGKNGNYLGLIQFGPEERKKYGVHEGQSAGDQVLSAENFLRDRGVKPGMGLPDIYSTINAGSPGLYNRSDANNGGAPGTVMDKVRNQMAGHRVNAVKLLGGDVGMISQARPRPPDSSAAPPTAGGGVVPTATSPAAPAPMIDINLMAQLQAIPKMLAAQQANQQFAPPAPVVDNMRARMAAIAAARQLGQET
jgi:hypothetical protein